MKLRFDTWHFYWSDSNPFFLSNFAIYFSVCFTIFQKLARWRKNCQKGGCVKPSSKVPFINKSKKMFAFALTLDSTKIQTLSSHTFPPWLWQRVHRVHLEQVTLESKILVNFSFRAAFYRRAFHTGIAKKNYIICLLFIITHKLWSGKNFIVFSSW